MNYVRETLAIDRIQRVLDSVDPDARSRVIGFVYDQEISRKLVPEPEAPSEAN